MDLLLLGLTLWTVVHFIPSLGQSIKKRWVGALGEKYYALSFTIIVLVSLAFIIFGWRSSIPKHIYILPMFTKHIAMALIVIAFILFGSAKHPSKIKQYIRHPQLLGVIVWSFAHLILNGDTRSVLLFGWLGFWAAAEIILINKRDGEWVKELAPNWKVELKGLGISLSIVVALVFAHPYIAGVPIK